MITINPQSTKTGDQQMTEAADQPKLKSEHEHQPAKMADKDRLKQAVIYHGLAALGLFAVWMAADTWYITTSLLLANMLNVVTALVVGSYLSGLFHEWGHFAAARLTKSYAPLTTKIRGVFIFGFDFAKNHRNQFLAMSLGGPLANWFLVLLVMACIPLDNLGRAALFAMVFARAVSVCFFEVPVIVNVFHGADPQRSLEERLNSGALNQGQVWGYLAGGIIWLVAI